MPDHPPPARPTNGSRIAAIALCVALLSLFLLIVLCRQVPL